MQFVKGNIFDCDAEALVNTVNTVGVMGKGVALQFKERFPLNYELYVIACKKGEVQVGKMFITATSSLINPKWIINFPTKQHWHHKSNYTFIKTGLDDLVEQVKNMGIASIAIPPLGAGQGGLDWGKVKLILADKLSVLSNVEITIFEPAKVPQSQVSFEKTSLTKARAMILALINQYSKLGYDTSLLEIQKLAYFLQRMGQNDLKLNYKQYYYGPYAHNLQHLLHELEKGYLRSEKSILDSKPLDIVYLNTDSVIEADEFITKNCSDEEKERLIKLFGLMEGFESPFGLELLSSVDWIIFNDKIAETSILDLKEKISNWSKRKDAIFNIEHLNFAVNRLKRFGRELNYTFN